MFDYTTIMIARHEHAELARKGTPEYGVRIAHDGLVRRALSGLGDVLMSAGGWLKERGNREVAISTRAARQLERV
jgi:hypothetical protein